MRLFITPLIGDMKELGSVKKLVKAVLYKKLPRAIQPPMTTQQQIDINANQSIGGLEQIERLPLLHFVVD